jgi:hypothetical protein
MWGAQDWSAGEIHDDCDEEGKGRMGRGERVGGRSPLKTTLKRGASMYDATGGIGAGAYTISRRAIL